MESHRAGITWRNFEEVHFTALAPDDTNSDDTISVAADHTAYGQSREAKDLIQAESHCGRSHQPSCPELSRAHCKVLNTPRSERLALINLLGCDIVPAEQAMSTNRSLNRRSTDAFDSGSALLAARAIELAFCCHHTR